VGIAVTDSELRGMAYKVFLEAKPGPTEFVENGRPPDEWAWSVARMTRMDEMLSKSDFVRFMQILLRLAFRDVTAAYFRKYAKACGE